MKILITAPYFMPVVERFRPVFAQHGMELIVPTVEERMEEADLMPYINEIAGTICGDDRYTPALIEKARQLKVISKWGTGIDSIDQAACRAKGIAVRNTLNAFTIPVSDSVMAYMLSFVRQTHQMNQAMHGGIWQKIPGKTLAECTLGVVGVGNIGKAVLRKAQAFGMRLLATDIRQVPAAELHGIYVEMTDLDSLLKASDFVSINCDLNPSSHHLMRAERFALMKPGAVLINTARGPIVKEADLVDALQSGLIGGAGLDVFEFEPLPHSSPLMQMDNVLMAPHNSNSSPAAWEAVHISTVNNLFEELIGKRVL